MYLKRQKTPKTWPIARKGTAYVVRPNSNLNSSVPVLIALRDMLKIAKNRNEVKKALQSKKIVLNSKPVVEEKSAIKLLDVLTLVPVEKSYRLIIGKNGKFLLEEILKADVGKKSSKIIGKKILKGKKVQLNLIDGRNILSDLKCKLNDSVVLNFKENKIEKVLELKKGEKIFVFGGKHAGTFGKIENVDLEKKIVEINSEEKGNLNILIKQLMVVEK